MTLTCVCSSLLFNSYYEGKQCDIPQKARADGLCFNAKTNKARIKGLLRQPSSLHTMVVSSTCSIVKTNKNGSYQRRLIELKKPCFQK